MRTCWQRQAGPKLSRLPPASGRFVSQQRGCPQLVAGVPVGSPPCHFRFPQSDWSPDSDPGPGFFLLEKYFQFIDMFFSFGDPNGKPFSGLESFPAARPVRCVWRGQRGCAGLQPACKAGFPHICSWKDVEEAAPFLTGAGAPRAHPALACRTPRSIYCPCQLQLGPALCGSRYELCSAHAPAQPHPHDFLQRAPCCRCRWFVSAGGTEAPRRGATRLVAPLLLRVSCWASTFTQAHGWAPFHAGGAPLPAGAQHSYWHCRPKGQVRPQSLWLVQFQLARRHGQDLPPSLCRTEFLT